MNKWTAVITVIDYLSPDKHTFIHLDNTLLWHDRMQIKSNRQCRATVCLGSILSVVSMQYLAF